MAEQMTVDVEIIAAPKQDTDENSTAVSEQVFTVKDDSVTEVVINVENENSTAATESLKDDKTLKINLKCPFQGCPSLVKPRIVKRHVFYKHLPCIFWDNLDTEEADKIGYHSKRSEALELISNWLQGPDKPIEQLCDLLNNRSTIKDHACVNSPRTVEEMQILCELNGWTVPAKFQCSPANSPASLIHWRNIATLLSYLSEEQRAQFSNKFKSNRAECERLKGKKKKSVELLNKGCSNEGLVISDNINGEEHVAMHTQSNSEDVKSEGLPVLQELSGQLVPAIDCLVHLEWASRKSSPKALIESILAQPSGYFDYRVDVKGLVACFSNPRTHTSALAAHPYAKVSVGIHPGKITTMSDKQWSQFGGLLQDQRVVAMGEVGLDMTQPVASWQLQIDTLHKVFEYFCPRLVLVLRIKGCGYGSANTDDLYSRTLEIVKEYCGRSQRIHLASFDGTAADVRGWLNYFRNTYFGFSANVVGFSVSKLSGLVEVPRDHILLESDASCNASSAPNRTVNIPASLADIGQLVADKKQVCFQDLMHYASQNAIRLYKFT